MARKKSTQWKYDLIKITAIAVNVPGGSTLLRNTLAPVLSNLTGWTKSTVCKYVEVELGFYYRNNW